MPVALKDICTFQSGGTPSKSNPEYFNGSIPWITTVALNGRTIGENNAVDWITDKAIQESAAKIVPAQSIMVGTRVGVGKVAVNSVPMSTSQDIISLVGIDENRWSKDYICKFIQSKGSFLLAQARGATIKGIKIDVLADLQVPEIALDEQRKIVRTLEHLLDSIDIRQKQLDTLDELVKARFVEMFGDAENNDHRWTTKSLDALFEITSSKRILKSEWKDHGIPFLRVRDMVQLADTGRMDNEFFVSEEFYSGLSDSDGIPTTGDILVSATSTLGKCHIVLEGEKFYFKDADVLRFRPTTDIIPRYFVEAIKTDYVNNQIERTLGVTTVSHFTIKAAKTIMLRVPPLSLQEQFVSFVSQVDKSKLSIQASLDKLETLKQSLMQEYFG